MATTITGIMQEKVLTNLDTYNHTTLTASMYTVQVMLMEVPPSGCTITISQSGSTTNSVSTAVPAATQNHVELRTVLNCAINDNIAVTLASSTASDTGPNAIKALLKITPGLV